jgi:choline dehydrogenase-like flavoprotein
MPPLPYDPQAKVVIQGAKKLGLHPYPAPLAILSEPYDGRPACIHCLYCSRFKCEVAAKSSIDVTMIPKALKTGLCQLRAQCFAREVLVDKRGRVRGVSYCGPDWKLYEQPADLVIVSCSATESCRLPLNSKSKLFPTGLSNRTDQVGRNVMDHTGGAAVLGFFEEETFVPQGPGFTVVIADFVHRNGSVLGGGALMTFSDYYQPLAFCEELRRAAGATSVGKGRQGLCSKAVSTLRPVWHSRAGNPHGGESN